MGGGPPIPPKFDNPVYNHVCLFLFTFVKMIFKPFLFNVFSAVQAGNSNGSVWAGFLLRHIC